MRQFSNWDNVSIVKPDITLTVDAADGSEVFTFDRNSIRDISDIVWEVPFTGGLSKPSNYDIDLSIELPRIKQIIANVIGGVARLKIDVNSNTFFPHVGRVRSYERIEANELKLKIFDKFFDDKQFFPKELITDSFDTPHLEELLSGYPVYYGKHTRPFYHTAVTSDVSQLIGPRNVSSENHVNSVWFNSDFELGTTVDSFKNNLLINKNWDQQSGGTNISSGGYPFEVKDISPNDVRLWEPATELYYNLTEREIVMESHGGVSEFNASSAAQGSQRTFPTLIRPAFDSFIAATNVKGSFVFSNGVSPDSSTVLFQVAVSDPGSYTSLYDIVRKNVNNGDTFGDIFDVDIGCLTNQSRILTTGDEVKLFFPFYTSFTAGIDLDTLVTSIELQGQLKPEIYTRYSIFSPIVESSDIAIAENPQLIVEDIFNNHLSIGYVQDQSSDTQVNVQSYNFQCFFKDRQPIEDILDDFGRITQTNMWAGDSGSINFRSFDDAPTIDNSLDLSNVWDFGIREAPIGSSVTEQDLASKIKVKYNFDFQRNLFQNTKVADKNNTAECNSLSVIGFTDERTEETPYILELDTASLYLGGLVRKYSNPGEFVNFTGGAELFEMEIADCFNLEHPMIVGSNANYQAIRLTVNYISGVVKFVGAKLG